MKKFRNVLWGLTFIVIGLLIGGKILDIIDFDIFFDGWWTLFIIVPSFIGLFEDDSKSGSVIGLLIGVLLLLSCQGYLEFRKVCKLLLPAILIIIGVSFIFRDLIGTKVSKKIKELNHNKNGEKTEYRHHIATFSGIDLNFHGEVVTHMDLEAIFGGIDIDLRGAIIDEDMVINATAIFGGIDIKVPENVNVKIKSTSVFGGVSNEKPYDKEGERKTVYVNGIAVFGGVSVE